MTNNQIRWVLRIGKEYFDDKTAATTTEVADFISFIIVALTNNLFPETEPDCDEENHQAIIKLINNEKVIENVKQKIKEIE